MYTWGNDLESSANPTSTQRAWVWRGLRLAVILLLVGVLVLCGTTLPAPTAFAATQNVTDCSSTSDNSGGGVGTLTYALAHYATGDTISFQCSGDIIIPSTINVANTLTLDATGYSVTLDGNNASEILNVTSSGNLTINNLTITKGQAPAKNVQNYYSAGGGIYNSGALTVKNSTFSSNYATNYGAAIYNATGATLNSVTNSSFITNTADSFGGAITNYGTITSITSSTFNSNTSNDGGAIFNVGSISSITNTTFNGNKGYSEGEAIDNESGGTISTISSSTFNANSGNVGALENYNTITNLTNSTFAANTGYAIRNSGTSGSMALNHVTFYSNSNNAILNYTTITVKNSLFAKGTGGNNCNKVSGTFTDNGYNLSDDASCGFTSTGSQNSATLNMGALQNNGGPTLTIAPLAGNPAIAKIPSASCLSTDQRGYPRPANGSSCDVGAVELTQLGDTTATNCQESNLNAALKTGGYILVDCPANTTITATTVPDTNTNYRSISISTTLDASPSTGFTISGANSSGTATYQLFTVGSSKNFTLNSLTLTKGKTSQGGGINNSGTLVVSNCTFTANSTLSGYGGAIFNNSNATISNISNSTFSSNSGSINGGAIYNSSGATISNISNSTFNSNSANSSTAYGGAINNQGTITTIISTTFSSNSATSSSSNGEGGAIFNSYIINNISNSTFSSDSASSSYVGGQGWGGAIYNNGTISYITNTTFASNSANNNGQGGAIYNSSSINNVLFATFNGNNATTSGAIYNAGSTIIIKSSLFEKGTSGGNCYGVSLSSDGQYNLYDDNTCFNKTSANVTDAQLNLGTLLNNGGTTQTILPQSGSSAIDAIPNGTNGCGTTVTTDQRGIKRPQGSACDVGAAEVVQKTLVKTGGDNQSQEEQLEYSLPLTVTLTDSNNNGVSGVVVTFSAPAILDSSAPTIVFASNLSTTITATTDVNGNASSGLFYANSATGAVAVMASVSSSDLNSHVVKPFDAFTPVTFNLTNTINPNAVTALTVNATSLNFIAGGSNAQNLQLKADAPTNWTSSINYGAGASNWLSLDKTSGTLVPLATQNVGLSLDNAVVKALANNIYTATVAFVSTNNQNNRVLVNISLQVDSVSSHTYYLPFLGNNADGYSSYLAIQNVGNATANFSLKFYDTNGALLTTPTLQDTCAVLAIKAECIPTNPFGNSQAGTGLITSDQPLNIIVAESTPLGGSAYAVPSGSSNSLIAPLILRNAYGDFNTRLTIFNGGTSATDVTVTFYDQNGDMVPSANQSQSVAANTTWTLDQSAAANLPDSFNGWAVISAPSGSQLVAQVLEQSQSQKFVAIANAQPFSKAASTLYAPAIFKGAFGFVTGANIVNPNAVPVQISITYYDDSGKAYPTPSFTLKPNAIAAIYQGDSSSILSSGFSGSAEVKSNGGNVVMLVNESGGSANGKNLAGVYAAASAGSSTIGLPIMANGGYGYTTGATVQNIIGNTISGSIQYYNLDGTAQGTAQPFTIAPFASQLIYQGDAVQNLPSGSDGFYGTAVITENNGGNDLIATTNAASTLFYTYTEPSN